MRDSWATEIEQMDSNHRAWFLEREASASPCVRDEPSPPPSPHKKGFLSSLFGASARKRRKQQEAKARARLEKYHTRLQEYLGKFKDDISDARAKIEETRREARRELDLLNRWKMDHLLRSCRECYQLKLALLEAKIDFSRLARHIVEERDSVVHSKLKGKSVGAISRDFCMDALELCKHDPVVVPYLLFMRTLANQTDNASDKYIQSRQNVKPMSRSERVNQARSLLAQAVFDDHDTHVHRYVEAQQLLFDRLFADERVSEGRVLRAWCDQMAEMRAQRSPIGAQDVIAFIEKYAYNIAVDFQISDAAMYDALHTFTNRLAFRLGSAHLFLPEEDAEADVHFVHQCRWLSRMTMAQLGVEDKYIPIFLDDPATVPASHLTSNTPGIPAFTVHGAVPTLPPYFESIDQLEELGLHLAPLDMLMCIVRASKTVFQLASEYANQNEYLSEQQRIQQEMQEQEAQAPDDDPAALPLGASDGAPLPPAAGGAPSDATPKDVSPSDEPDGPTAGDPPGDALAPEAEAASPPRTDPGPLPSPASPFHSAPSSPHPHPLGIAAPPVPLAHSAPVSPIPSDDASDVPASASLSPTQRTNPFLLSPFHSDGAAPAAHREFSLSSATQHAPIAPHRSPGLGLSASYHTASPLQALATRALPPNHTRHHTGHHLAHAGPGGVLPYLPLRLRRGPVRLHSEALPKGAQGGFFTPPASLRKLGSAPQIFGKRVRPLDPPVFGPPGGVPLPAKAADPRLRSLWITSPHVQQHKAEGEGGDGGEEVASSHSSFLSTSAPASPSPLAQESLCLHKIRPRLFCDPGPGAATPTSAALFSTLDLHSPSDRLHAPPLSPLSPDLRRARPSLLQCTLGAAAEEPEEPAGVVAIDEGRCAESEGMANSLGFDEDEPIDAASTPPSVLRTALEDTLPPPVLDDTPPALHTDTPPPVLDDTPPPMLHTALEDTLPPVLDDTPPMLHTLSPSPTDSPLLCASAPVESALPPLPAPAPRPASCRLAPLPPPSRADDGAGPSAHRSTLSADEESHRKAPVPPPPSPSPSPPQSPRASPAPTPTPTPTPAPALAPASAPAPPPSTPTRSTESPKASPAASPSRKVHILAADNFFPILVYCVVHSGILNPHACLRFMSSFVGPRYRQSELGYYLTSYQCALEYIQRATPHEVAKHAPTARAKDEILRIAMPLFEANPHRALADLEVPSRSPSPSASVQKDLKDGWEAVESGEGEDPGDEMYSLIPDSPGGEDGNAPGDAMMQYSLISQDVPSHDTEPRA